MGKVNAERQLLQAVGRLQQRETQRRISLVGRVPRRALINETLCKCLGSQELKKRECEIGETRGAERGTRERLESEFKSEHRRWKKESRGRYLQKTTSEIGGNSDDVPPV